MHRLVVARRRSPADQLGCGKSPLLTFLANEAQPGQLHATDDQSARLAELTAQSDDAAKDSPLRRDVRSPGTLLGRVLVEQVGELLAEIARRGVSILLVEQKLAIALRISARIYVMGHGRIVFQGTPDDFGENSAVRKEWLEV